MLRRVTRPARTLGAGLPAVVCALAAHAVIYRSLWPADGAHGYFAWYEPLVAALSAAALAGFAGLLVLAALGRRSAPLVGLRTRLAGGTDSTGFVAGAARLGRASLAVLLAQESLERSLQAGRPAAPVFTATEALTVFAAVALFAVLLTAVLRWLASLAQRILFRPAPTGPRTRGAESWARCEASAPRRRSPLAVGRGLRAPPLLAG